ncbi:hypothetical protein BBF96_03635 [Anoxybacter fermentans]|uniref:Uncharacterized protein n=1 Tax=Anoxybacter fermentans TaxID=1323375 RepID=A0A3S9SW94_9FIRM|nr:hypothetical protein [Anoxybacter fermentans]AZR72554.1 hypothetical protein BBF96_03635 [Anoxybacter fermentans]
MAQNLLSVNHQQIVEMEEMLDRLEERLLKYEIEEEMVNELVEIGYWANELLQSRISYRERQSLVNLIQRVRYLQILYLESFLNLRVNQLSQELKGLISDQAWQIYLRLDELRGMEREFFKEKDYHLDFNTDLLNLEQELIARLVLLKLTT